MSQGISCNNYVSADNSRHNSYCVSTSSTPDNPSSLPVLPDDLSKSIRSTPALYSHYKYSLLERVLQVCKDTIWGCLTYIASIIKIFFKDGYIRIISLVYGRCNLGNTSSANNPLKVKESIGLRKYIIDRCSNHNLHLGNGLNREMLKVVGSYNYFIIEGDIGIIKYLDVIINRIHHVESINESVSKISDEKNKLLNKLVDDTSRDVQLLKNAHEHENKALNTIILNHFTQSKSGEKLTAENIIKTLYDAEHLDMKDSCYESVIPQEAVEQDIQTNCLSKMAISRYNLRLIILDIALQIYERLLKNNRKNLSSSMPSGVNEDCNMEQDKPVNIKRLYIRSINAAISKFKVSEADLLASLTFIPKNEARNMPLVNEYYNILYERSASSKCSHKKRFKVAEKGNIEH